jgi:putative alpha-1,2-fucosyltransferase
LECREGYKDSFLFNYRLVVSSGPEEDGFEDSLKYFNVKEYTTTEKN